MSEFFLREGFILKKLITWGLFLSGGGGGQVHSIMLLLFLWVLNDAKMHQISFSHLEG